MQFCILGTEKPFRMSKQTSGAVAHRSAHFYVNFIFMGKLTIWNFSTLNHEYNNNMKLKCIIMFVLTALVFLDTV